MRANLVVLAALSVGLAACSRSSAPPAYSPQYSSLPPPPVMAPAPMPNVAAMQQLQGQVACVWSKGTEHGDSVHEERSLGREFEHPRSEAPGTS